MEFWTSNVTDMLVVASSIDSILISLVFNILPLILCITSISDIFNENGQFCEYISRKRLFGTFSKI